MPERLLIVPTYNIREIPGSVLVLQPSFETLVVDDNSPDGTAAIVRDMITVHPGRIHLLERKGKLGLGTAYIAGFRWAMERGYGHVFEMDADFSHDPKDLPRLYAACAEGGADMSVGSRYVKGGKVSDWSWDRVLLSYTASLYVRAVLWLAMSVRATLAMRPVMGFGPGLAGRRAAHGVRWGSAAILTIWGIFTAMEAFGLIA